MKKVEYSQIVRRKLKTLRARLTSEFGSEVSRKSLKQITDAARSLESFAELKQIRLLLQKCSMIGKILCINCLVFQRHHRSHLIIGMNRTSG